MTLPPLTANGWLRWDVVRRRWPPQARTVLEVGCGQGAVGARLAARSLEYVGVEPDPASAAVARDRLAALGTGAVFADLAELAPSDRFDVVCAFEVLEHIQDDRAALRTWIGRLAPGGTLLLSVPAHAGRFGAADVHVGHIRRYDPPALAALARSAGLQQVSTTLYGMPLGYLLEGARNRLAARSGSTGPAGSSLAERTGHSGRWHQPAAGASTPALWAATAPFRLLQRAFPHTGPGLVLQGRLPAG